jgi:large subunit ribosomal protein L4
MKTKTYSLDFKAVGEVDLDEKVFGRAVRADLLARAVNWQLNKRRSGNHQTKTIAFVSGTTKKPFKQKGTGNARQGSLRSPQMRGGAIIFGPLKRSHETDLQKKVRKLALCTALSAKQADGKLFVLDAAKMDAIKTKTMANKLAKFGSKVLVIDGAQVDEKFALSLRNIKNTKMLPEQGANVYDIIKHDTLVLTQNAVEQLTQRLTAIKVRGAAKPAKVAADKKPDARKVKAAAAKATKAKTTKKAA